MSILKRHFHNKNVFLNYSWRSRSDW